MSWRVTFLNAQRRPDDLSVGHRFSAPLAWQSMMGGTEYVKPFLHERQDRSGLRTWFRLQKPDAIIVGQEKDGRDIADSLGLRVFGDVEFALTDHSKAALFSGIDQRAAEIGRASVEQLHARILSGEKGIPAVPSLTMVKGMWVPARR